MYDNVLLPIQERTATQTRIETAINISKQNNSCLHILFILDIEVETGASKERFLNEFNRRGKKRIKEISNSIQGTLEIASSVKKGTLPKVVADYQSENNIDLTVINGDYYDRIKKYHTRQNMESTPDYIVTD